MVLALFHHGRSEPCIVCRRLYLRPPRRGDWRPWAELRSGSREHLTPWEPTWAPDALSRTAFRRRLQRYAEDWARDTGYAFFIFEKQDDTLVGGVTMSNVRRGVAQSCSVGYWVGLPHTRKGYMTEALGGAVTFAFEHLGLHRIEAACLPSNAGSRKVLTGCGFVEEGLARRYLRIDGRWQDHMLFALLREDRSAARR